MVDMGLGVDRDGAGRGLALRNAWSVPTGVGAGDHQALLVPPQGHGRRGGLVAGWHGHDHGATGPSRTGGRALASRPLVPHSSAHTGRRDTMIMRITRCKLHRGTWRGFEQAYKETV